jgi:hypothetical protein
MVPSPLKGAGNKGVIQEAVLFGQYRYLKEKQLVRWALEGSPLFLWGS